MKMKTKSVFIVLSILSAIGILAASFIFIDGVKSLLWEKSVTDILEVTEQGKHALDTFIDKDYDTLHLFASELSEVESADKDSIQRILNIFDDDTTSFYCVNLDTGESYSDNIDISVVDEERRQEFLGMQPSGIREPFYDGYTGVRSIGVYEQFTFADGTHGLVQKTRSVKSIRDHFTLSFYNNTGFSYIINLDGDVLIRSLHKNSNRTIQNLFDMINMEGNNEALSSDVKEQLSLKHSGATQFFYKGEDYIFTYVPMENGDNWYVVSIIPSQVVMKQANTIIDRTMRLCIFIMICLAVLGYVYHRNSAKQKKKIEKLAFYDQLTGLYRYEKFLIDGEARLSSGDMDIAVLYIDILGFKLLNDIEGYNYGDTVLKYMADVLRQISHSKDISCRISGDDFLLMIEYKNREDIPKLCQRIISQVENGFDQEKKFKVRIGICLVEEARETNINGIIDRAKMAQTGVKEDSSISYQFYNKTMREALLRDAQMEQSMVQALDNGEFIYMIQPKYSLDGTKILGGEALVRWQKPDGQFISPGEFIPLFERNGFIRQLDEYVFTKVCEDLHNRIQKKQKIVPISVNVSRVHLYSENFAERYNTIKNKYEIPDNLIELELTESILLENTKEIFGILEQLKKYGFLCSIDDFGSGYSSLNTLKDLPVDIVKLDKVFFDQSDHLDRKIVILKSMIDMAKQLYMKVVAEGIEEDEQLEMLKNTGCDMVQGFIYSKPCIIDDFYQHLEK